MPWFSCCKEYLGLILDSFLQTHHERHCPKLLSPALTEQGDELHGDFGDSTESEIATVICHVLTGLSYMHGCGVAHRDLKPDNIMYSRESGSVRIIDYGLAKICDEGVRMRTVTGTLGYTAPEVFGATGYNMLCDTWSVGIITY